MSENNQGPPPVPNNKPKGTANESKTPPPLPKAKIITLTSPQDVVDNTKVGAETGKNLPPKLPGKKNNTPPPLATSMPQNETGSAKIDAKTGKILPPKLPNRKSKTPPPLAPSMPQNARQTIFLPNSQTTNPGAIQSGNKGKGKLFLFIFGVAAALILIVSISNGGGNDVPLDRGHAFERSDDQKNDSEDREVRSSEPKAQPAPAPVPEPKTYAYDESSNSQQGGNSTENTEGNVNRIANGLIGAIITNTKKTCKNCKSQFNRGTGVSENCEETNSGNEEFCDSECCQEY